MGHEQGFELNEYRKDWRDKKLAILFQYFFLYGIQSFFRLLYVLDESYYSFITIKSQIICLRNLCQSNLQYVNITVK